MPLIPDIAVFRKTIAALPLATYQAGETVLTAGSTTGRLLILKEGAVEVVKECVQIAKVAEPGAVFGELSVLLDTPHTADMGALETSQLHVADAAALLARDPIALLCVAAVWHGVSTAPTVPYRDEAPASGRRAAQRDR